MTVLVSLPEIQKIVKEELLRRDLRVAGEGTFVRHMEGQYEEQVEVVNGISFELEEPVT